MIYKAIPFEDNFIENTYKKSLDELNNFYEIGWVHHLPKIVIVDDRKTINLLRGEKTEDWLTGWSEGQNVFFLNKDNFEKESNHKYSPDTYSALIKHELSHSFFKVLSSGQSKPIWLNEGVAIYISGQNDFKKKPSVFSNFLEFYDNGGKKVYSESGFFVQALVEKYGKQKLLDLIKELKKIKSKEEFENYFKKEYGFKLSYEEINKQLIK